MVLTDLDEVFVNGKAYDLKDCQIDALKVKELFRGYVQKLELLALQKNENIQKFAKQALDKMHLVLKLFKDESGVDILGL